ncbi:putative LRR receptor-like serine/threonine-protein kinase [Planoprotostelium fungivorum]|uniref:non-specific serine/threonine protein kinase n=1 Tax=Planoprotostelium fungivorum TaxID=1890364 RepID=A0A2P6P0T3_9EUKA|nr:putative LRR receptor-like serine/threonine-protein kinase [Planoprotostelium fungivorum]
MSGASRKISQTSGGACVDRVSRSGSEISLRRLSIGFEMASAMLVFIVFFSVTLAHGVVIDAQQGTKGQLQALQKLYYYTDGQMWTNNSYWTGNDPCKYYGITCDTDNQTIISINLAGETFCFDLKMTSGLRMLNLGLNNVTGVFPEWIVNLTALTYVDLRDTYLWGKLPEDLGRLLNLTHFIVGDTLLDGLLYSRVPDSWGMLVQLEKFDISGHSFDYINLTALGGMQRLETFTIFGNSFSGNFQDEAGPYLPQLKSLKYIDIRFTVQPNSVNQFYGEIPDLSASTSLESFQIGYNSFVGTFPEWVTRMQNMSSIMIGPNLLSGQLPSSISNMKKLVTCDVVGSGFDGPLPDIWDQLPNISEMFLFSNRYCLAIFALFDSFFSSSDVNSFNGTIPESLYRSHSLTYLQLTSNRFTGTISPSIGNLSLLQSFYVGFNQMEGTIPEQLFSCTNLLSIQLAGNNFTGNISAGFQNLSQMRIIALGHNKFVGSLPDSFASMQNLTTMDFSYNGFTGSIPSSLSTLSKLQYLSLNDNQFSGSMPVLSPSLINVQIQRNRLSGTLFWMLQLSSLQLIDISDNKFIGPASPISGKKYLTHCDFSRNRLAGRIPVAYTNIMPLTYLDLSSNQISGPIEYSLGRLTLISYLNLSNNHLSGSVEPRLAQLSTIQYLDLSMNRLDGSVPSGVLGLAKLLELRLDNNFLTGPIDSISNAKSLNTLILSNNAFSGGLSNIFTLHNLVNLNISFNQISGSIPDSIGQLSGLQVLDVSHNRLSGTIPDAIGSLRNLQSIGLSNNKLTGQMPFLRSDPRWIDLSSNSLNGPLDFLNALSSLTYLNVSRNQFEEGIDTLNGMKGLITVDISHNRITGLPSLFGLFNLVEFIASNNQIEGALPNMTLCFALRRLFLDNNALSDASLVPNMMTLDRCDVRNNSFVCPVTAQMSERCGATCSIDNFESAEMQIRIAGDLSTFSPDQFTSQLAQVAGISISRIHILKAVSGSVIVDLKIDPPPAGSTEGSASRVVQYLNSIGSSVYNQSGISVLNVYPMIPDAPPAPSTSLSKGVIAGIVLGSLVVFIALVLLIVLVVLRPRKVLLQKPNFEMVDFTVVSNSETKNSVIPFDEIENMKLIGSGAFGYVYKAVWRANTVAVKQVRSENVTTEQVLDFLKEAQLIQNMRPHPNVVLYLGYTFPPDPLSIVTEFCFGGSLLDYLKNTPDIPEDQIRSFIVGTARGVLHLHQEKIIHRDLAARNILLTKHLEAKVSDFGMSRQVSTYESPSVTTTTIGPVRWMSPEAIQKREYSVKSDGVVMWEILTRKEPWHDVSAVDVAVSVTIHQERLPIPEDIPSDMREVMEGVWKVDPSERPDLVEICKLLGVSDIDASGPVGLPISSVGQYVSHIIAPPSSSNASHVEIPKIEYSG